MSTEVRICARPIVRRHKDKAKRAVIGYHGYMGYAGELFLPLDLLYQEGFDVFSPRYPGHGTSGEDFMSTDVSMWVEEAENAYRSIMDEYEEIYLIGHSMGGLMAAHVAHTFDVPKMVLYAPAFVLKQNIPAAFLSFLSLFVKRKRIPWQADPAFPLYGERGEGDDVYLGGEYWSYIYYRQTAGLERLRRKILPLLPEMRTETLVFTGGEDAVISEETGALVEKGMKGENNRWVHLQRATHLIPYDKDDASRDQAMQETILFLST